VNRFGRCETCFRLLIPDYTRRPSPSELAAAARELHFRNPQGLPGLCPGCNQRGYVCNCQAIPYIPYELQRIALALERLVRHLGAS